MTDFVLTFAITKGSATVSNPAGLSCCIEYGRRLEIDLFYDFDPKPLSLCASANIGDTARLCVRRCRVELYINGMLQDEEWPAGSCRITEHSICCGDFAVNIRRLNPPEETKQPSVLRSAIKGVEIRQPGINIGDCMPYADENGDGRYHLFYLYDRHHHKSKWGLGAHQWAHVSSRDLVHWDEHPMAIPISQQWEGSICTGSVIRAENKWYAWYAVRMTDRSPARLTYAVSEDLYHFHKCGDYFHIPDTYEQTGARDPKLFFHDGLYHMLVTTSLMSDGSGCLAHLVNEKMSVHGWREAACIMRWHDYCAPDSPHRSGKPECADWFQMGDFYYLVFGIGSISRYLISRMPYGPWT